MIQISAVPAAAMPIQADQQGEAGTEPTISAEFSALLAAKSSSAGSEPASGSVQVPAKLQGLTGKPGGKALPLPPRLAVAFVTEAAMEPAKPFKVATDATEQIDQPPPPDPAVPQAVPLLAQIAALIPSMHLVAQPLPEASALGPVVPQGMQPAISGPLPRQPAPLQPAAAMLQQTLLPPEIRQDGTLPQYSPPSQLPVLAMAPGTIPGTAAKPALEVRLPLIVPTQPAAPGMAPSPMVPVEATASTSVPPPVTVSAAVAMQMTQVRPGQAKDAERVNGPSSTRSAEAAPAVETLAIPAPSPEPTAQPLFAMTQGQAASTTDAAPRSPASNYTEAPADFSSLVDRLVAAREAAQSSLAPHAIHAAIAHAEFGQVSLRFEQQDGGLSVAMASPDPDFARSVLAAAPASQQGADNADSRGSATRQETSQSMAQPQGQTQGQSGGQGPQRHQPQFPQAGSQQGQASTSNSTANSEGPATRRRGIFA